MINIGKIVRTVGLKGDMRFHPYSENSSIDENLKIYIDEKQYQVKSIKPFKDQFTLHLEGIDAIEQADPLVGLEVYMEKDDIYLDEDEFLVIDLIGMSVVSDQNEPLGVVTDVISRSAQDILVINDMMIPFVKEFIVSIEDSVITVHLIEGMR